MKKILTLFVMLLCGWSIVSAQTPAFGYQVVVRTADNELVANTSVGDVTITVNGVSELYKETQKDVSTDDLGMLNLLVGLVKPAEFANVNWSNAINITTTFTVNGELVTVSTPIYAVPCALQADKATLTTDQIVDYLEEATIEDYAAIMEALGANEDSEGEMWNMIKQKLANYLKSRKDKAVDIAAYYAAHVTADDVTELYNEVKDNKEVMDRAVTLMYQYAIANRDYAMQLIPTYVKNLDAETDVDPLIQTVIQKINALTDEEKEDLENAVLPRLVSFAKSHRELAVNIAKHFLASADETQMTTLLNAFVGSNMEKVFVYEKFFNYLDYYFQANGLTQKIKDQVNSALQDEYLPKQGCTPEINPCAE